MLSSGQVGRIPSFKIANFSPRGVAYETSGILNLRTLPTSPEDIVYTDTDHESLNQYKYQIYFTIVKQFFQYCPILKSVIFLKIVKSPKFVFVVHVNNAVSLY